jgi:hypothetical protein
MNWPAAALVIAVAYGAALLYWPARGARWFVRAAAFCLAAAVIGATPLWVADAPFLRLTSGVVAVAFTVKLYDLAIDARSAASLGGTGHAVWLWNFAALVLREAVKIARPAGRRDPLRLAGGGAVFLAGGVLFLATMSADWSFTTFAMEHAVKVTSLFVMLIPGGVAYSAAWRLAGQPALEMMAEPYLARTPAEFWRRYNLPAQQFFYERVFKPSGGRRHPVRGTLATFAVSALIHEALFAVVLLRIEGYQTAFFMLHGLVVAATLGIRPRRAWSLIGWLATMAFLYTSSALFFASFESALDVYDNPLPWE